MVIDMANAEIVMIGTRELPIIVDLFNAVFRPARERAFFERRLQGRINPLILLAQIDRRPVGFAIGYENKPRTFYSWLIGVLPDFRRAGIASQLMEAMSAWACDHAYHIIRFECFNTQRPMLHLAISPDNKVVASGGTCDGVRVWDVATGKQKFALHQDKETRSGGVAFLPEGKILLTQPNGIGEPAYFWDAASGRPVSPVQTKGPE